VKAIHARNAVLVALIMVAQCRVFAQIGVGGSANAKLDLSQFVALAQSTDRDEWWPAAQALGCIASQTDNWRQCVWDQARVNTLGMKFALAPAGTFVMGPDIHWIFKIQWPHTVQLSHPFRISTCEVTNKQFQSLFPDYKSDKQYSPDPDMPAVNITWEMAEQFCARLSDLEGVTYRLPTEAEWEYACRAGTQTLYCFGNDVGELSEYAWYDYKNGRASAVGLLRPNAWGLYDVHGNAFEWVSDWYSDDYYAECARKGTVVDPQGPEKGTTHVLRSSGWQVRNVEACASTCRFPLPTFDRRPFDPDPVGMRQTIGFRIVRDVDETRKSRNDDSNNE
jgi:formylglycine-generating enzyme required for sulfatase activity